MIPLRVSLATLRWTFVATILLSSLITLIQASGSIGDAPNPAVMVLASVEIGAIIAFVSERWRGWSALILVLIFAIAFVGSAIGGEFALRFVYFGASAIYLQGGRRPTKREHAFG